MVIVSVGAVFQRIKIFAVRFDITLEIVNKYICFIRYVFCDPFSLFGGVRRAPQRAEGDLVGLQRTAKRNDAD